MIVLSERLNAIASMVTTSDVVADIGCDHAYIAIYLIENNVAGKVIACDVNKGPLVRALENAKQYNVGDRIELRLSDGLEKLAINEADTIVIAGMGGPLMQKIISDGMDKISEDSDLVLQPQSDIGTFRRFLAESGFKTLDEKMIYEDGKFYPMMKVRRGQSDYTADIDFEYGRILLASKNQILKEFLLHERENLTEIISGLSGDNLSQRTLDRKREINSRLELNSKAMRYAYEMQ